MNDIPCCCSGGEKSGCMLCGKPLTYDEHGKMMTCAVCGRQEWAHEWCSDGHYVCSACHMGPAGEVLRCLKQEKAKSASELLETMWYLPEVHLFGPEHHFLVACVLLTAYKNCGGELDLDAALYEAAKRGRAVVGGTCGYWGACGAAIGVGIAVSILCSSSPLNAAVWQLPQRVTAKTLEHIASYPGPRCCKRTCRLAVNAAVPEIERLFGVSIPVSWQSCDYHTYNKECIREKCPFFGKSAGVEA